MAARSTKRAGRRGGAGTSGGIDFQARVGAWLATAILAEAAAPAPWGWPTDSTLQSLDMETGEPVDDLLVTNSLGSSAYLQAKLTLSLSAAEGSDFASVISAFVLQHIGGTESRGRPLRKGDRLVLAVGPACSGLIREDLRRVIDRVRGLHEGGTLDSVTRSRRERQAFDALVEHARSAWRAASGEDASQAELRAFIQTIWISVFDLSEEGSDAIYARGQLRGSVLVDPTQEPQAWGILISLVASLAAVQSGADRQRLQKLLADKGVGLRPAPSYRADIERLRAYSSTIADRLRPYSMIRLPASAGEIKIRRSVSDAVLSAISDGSLVITGDPGVGKSAAVSELIATLTAQGRDVVAFAADAVDVRSLGQLRHELALDHEVVDVLRSWPGENSGVLVIDGLDAARGEGTQDVLSDLIAATTAAASRWTVVASIRRFDLRYNHKLKDLFPVARTAVRLGKHTSAEFATVKHLVVPDLSEDELAQLHELAPALAALLEAAPGDLRELARVPFNLRLLAELVRLDIEPSELEPISTQIELLDKYWHHRVVGSDRDGDSRRAVIDAVVREMVANRLLQANRRAALGTHLGTALNDLLSEQVLAEQGVGSGQIEDEILVFSHHVLFDYAVDRVMLRGVDGTVARAILAEPDLVVFARPSFDLHFRHVWGLDTDRRRFWNASLELVAMSEVPKIGWLIAPVVAAEQIHALAEFAGLLEHLDSADDEGRLAAEETLRHLVSTATSSDPKLYLRDRRRRTAWSAFAAALAERELRASTAFSLRQLVWSLADDVERLDAPERHALGQAARRYLAYAFDQPDAHRALTWPGIASVSATYETDPAASRELLGQILGAERLERAGYLEVPDLAREVTHLVDQDPSFVRDIYSVAFAFEETSKKTTEMGGGPVFSLSSNRQQDYAHAHYTLAKAFPRFLEAAPLQATEALVAVRIAYAKGHSTYSPMESITFAWDAGRDAQIVSDGTVAWDQEPLGHDDEVKMLNDYEARLDHLAASAQTDALADLLEYLVRMEAPSAIWRRVFLAASRNPTIFTPLIRPLLVAPGVLALAGMTAAAGRFFAAGFMVLDTELRAEVERTISALPEYTAETEPDLGERAHHIGERLRDQLLGCLDPSDLVNADIRAHLEKMIEADEVPSNLDPGVIADWGSRQYGDREELGELGVDIDSEPNRQIQRLLEPIREFAKEHLNGSPSVEQVDGVLEPLQALWGGLVAAAESGVDELQAARAFGYAAEAAEAIARGNLEEQTNSSVDLTRQILLSAAEHREPTHDPESDANFDRHPGWGFPAPRVEAAAGLVTLARNAGQAQPEVLNKLCRLARDPVPAVRFQIARRLSYLCTTAPDLMWRIAEGIIAHEPSRAVVDSMLNELPVMTSGDFVRRREIAESLYLRMPSEGTESERVRITSASILADLDVGWDDQDAAAFIRREVLPDLGTNGEIARRVVFRLRSAVTYDGKEPDADAIRNRALSLVDDTLRNAVEQYKVLVERLGAKQTALGDEHPDLRAVRNIAQVIDTIGAEIYFASGAFRGNDDEPKVTKEQRGRLYREAGTILDRLADVPLAPVTHHLLETLEACIEFDPRGVFQRISRAVRGGKQGGYQLDNLAAGLFVSLVERYLAEYRTLFQRHEDMRKNLIEMLDLFVDAGWPKARQLTYGLHEAFR